MIEKCKTILSSCLITSNLLAINIQQLIIGFESITQVWHWYGIWYGVQNDGNLP